MEATADFETSCLLRAFSLAEHSIRVNCVAPGLIRAHYEKRIPLGRIEIPADCGRAAAF